MTPWHRVALCGVLACLFLTCAHAQLNCSAGFGMVTNPANDPPAKLYEDGWDTGALQGTTLRFTFINDGSVMSQYGEVLSDLEQTCTGSVCDDLDNDSRFTLLRSFVSEYSAQDELDVEFRVGTTTVTKVYVSTLGSIDFVPRSTVYVSGWTPSLTWLWSDGTVAALAQPFFRGSIYYAVDSDAGHTVIAFRKMECYWGSSNVLDFTVLISQDNFMQVTYHNVPADLPVNTVVGASLGAQPGSEWTEIFDNDWDTGTCEACPAGMASTEAGANVCVWCPGNGCNGHGECDATTGLCSSCDEYYSGSECEEMTCPAGFGVTANPINDPPAKVYESGSNTGVLQGTTLRFTFTEDGSVISQYGEVLSDLEQTCTGSACDDLDNDSRFTILKSFSGSYYSDQYELDVEFRVGTTAVTKVYVSTVGSIDFGPYDELYLSSWSPSLPWLWTYPTVAALVHRFSGGSIYYAVDSDAGHTVIAFRKMQSYMESTDLMDFTVLISQDNFMQVTYHNVPVDLQDDTVVGASLGAQPGSEWTEIFDNGWGTGICATCPAGMASTEAGVDACVWCPGNGCNGHGKCDATTGLCSSCDEYYSGSECAEMTCPVATGAACPPFTITSNPPAAEYQPHSFDLVGQTLRLTFTSLGVIPSYEAPISALEMTCSDMGCIDLYSDSRFESPSAYFYAQNSRTVYQVPVDFTFLGSQLSSVFVDTFGFVGFSDWSGDAYSRAGDVSWADFWKYPQLAAFANAFTGGYIYTAQDPLAGHTVIAFRDMRSGYTGGHLSSFTVLLSNEGFMQITYHIVSVEEDDWYQYSADTNDLIIVGLSLGATPASTWQPVTDGWSCNVTCATCPAGTASTTEGTGSCEACPGDGCSGHGTCDPATAVCTCTGLYTGDGCEERQNVNTSMVFGFVTLVLLLAFGIPCVCFGKEQVLAKHIARHKVHPFLWQIIVNMDVARHFKNMVAQKKALALVYEEQMMAASRTAIGTSIKRLIAALRQLVKLCALLGTIFFTTYIVLFLQMIGNVFLLAKGLFSSQAAALEERMDNIYATLHDFFSEFEFDWLSDMLVGVLKALGNIDFRVIAIDSMDVTCKGSQAPGLLFINLLVAIGIILLISLSVFPMLKITMSALIGTISDMLAIRRMMGQRGSRVIVVFLSAALTGFQGLFKYAVQLGASLMEFEAFFPRHPSTSYCDDSTMGMDTMLALLSTAIAMIFVLPLLHTLLRTFVPGIPKNVKFPSWDDYKAERNQGRERPSLYKSVKNSVSGISKSTRNFLSKSSTESKPELTDRPNTKLIEVFKPADPDLNSEWVLTHASFKENQSERYDLMNFIPTPNVPDSNLLAKLIFHEMFHKRGTTTTLRLYVYCMGWKLWKLLQISFGYWDDDAIRAFHIKELAQKFDDDVNDDADHHTTMISLVGVTHPLLWQLYSTTVVLSKFAEAVNEQEHPPFIVAKNSGITVQSMCSDNEVKLTPKSSGGEEVEELPAGRIAAVVAIRVVAQKNSEKSIVVVIRGHSTNFTEDVAVGGMLLLGARANDELHDEKQLLKVRVDEIVNGVCLRGTISEADFKRLPRYVVHLLKDYDVDKPHLKGYIDTDKKTGCCAVCASVGNGCARCCCCCCYCCCKSKDSDNESGVELQGQRMDRGQVAPSSFADKIEKLGNEKRTLPYKIQDKPSHAIVRTVQSFRSLFSGRFYKCIVRVSRFAAELGFVLTPSIKWLVVIFAVSLPSSIVGSLDTFQSCGVELTELGELLTNPFGFFFGECCSAGGLFGGDDSSGGAGHLEGIVGALGGALGGDLPGGDVLEDALDDSGVMDEMQNDAREQALVARSQFGQAFLGADELDVELPDGASETGEE